jgi:hypothetical protein
LLRRHFGHVAFFLLRGTPSFYVAFFLLRGLFACVKQIFCVAVHVWILMCLKISKLLLQNP